MQFDVCLHGKVMLGHGAGLGRVKAGLRTVGFQQGGGTGGAFTQHPGNGLRLGRGRFGQFRFIKFKKLQCAFQLVDCWFPAKS